MKRIFYNKSDASHQRRVLQKKRRYLLTELKGKSMFLKSQERTYHSQAGAINVPSVVDIDVVASEPIISLEL